MTKRALPSLFQSEVPVLPGPPLNKINGLASVLAAVATAIGDSSEAVGEIGAGVMPEFDPEKARSDFLIAMYNQLMNDINRHIVVVWQSVTALLGAFAAWSLIEKNIISLDVAVTFIIVIAIWGNSSRL